MVKTSSPPAYDFVHKRAMEYNWCMCMFFSVDLSGATAYKASIREYHPFELRDTIWSEAFSKFYTEFPKKFFERYVVAKTKAYDDYGLHQPVTWKYIGDEILFYSSVLCQRHLVDHIKRFHETLIEYNNDYLEKHDQFLRCKGTSWLVGFPVNNRIILIHENVGEKQQPLPRIDFLGPSVDTGFRLTKFASPQKLALSFELAWMLADYYSSNPSDNDSGWMRFYFDGKYELKGVNNSRPYPVFWLDMEYKKKSNGKESLADFEDTWLQREHKTHCDPNDVVKYCEKFQGNELAIIRPFISGDINGNFNRIPDDFDARRKIIQKFYTTK